MAELPCLGDHCASASCQTLDFLPIKCDLCCLKYCKQHYSYGAHNCTKYKELNINTSSSTPIPVYPCTLDGCKAKELIPITCEQCKSNFCVLHRLQIDHKCSKPSNIQNESIKPKINEFKFELKTNVSEKNVNLASKLVLMKLRQTATGPPGLPEESKLYCFIDYNTTIKKPFYLSTKWPIGRCIEFLCTKLNIKSHNKMSLAFENQEIINVSFTVQDLLDQKLVNHGIIFKLID
jgi:hypothetical protein